MQLQLAGRGFNSIHSVTSQSRPLTGVGSRERRQQRALLSGSVVDLHHVVQGRLEQDKLAEEDWQVFTMTRRGSGGSVADEKMS